jgi:hypothetical protein
MLLVRSSWLCRELIQESASTEDARLFVHDTALDLASPPEGRIPPAIMSLSEEMKQFNRFAVGVDRAPYWMAVNPSGFDEFFRSNYKQRRDDYRPNSL